MRAAGLHWRDAKIECIGAAACAEGVFPASDFESLKEIVLRIALEADDRQVVDFFTRQIIPLVTAGPQGTTGYAEGRPRVHPIFRYWPCLIDRRHVTPVVEFVDLPQLTETVSASISPKAVLRRISSTRQQQSSGKEKPSAPLRRILGDIAIARSGDKGATANIGIICRHSTDFSELKKWLTVERVATFLAPIGINRVERFELPNLFGLNFLVHGILSSGLRCDVQGKTLGQVLLEMPLDQMDDEGGLDE